jgi:uncharacterized Fe-S cluster-containing protein
MTVMERCTSIRTGHPQAKHAAGNVLQQFSKILGTERRLVEALHILGPQLVNGAAL